MIKCDLATNNEAVATVYFNARL